MEVLGEYLGHVSCSNTSPPVVSERPRALADAETRGIWNALCGEGGLGLKETNTHKGWGAEGEASASAWGGRPVTHVHERSVDVVATLPVDGDEEGQAAVRGQDVHAAVLLVVPGQQRDAAVFHAQRRRHHVQGLHDSTQTRGQEHVALRVTFTLRQIRVSSVDDGVPAPPFPAPPPILSALLSPCWILSTGSAHHKKVHRGSGGICAIWSD